MSSYCFACVCSFFWMLRFHTATLPSLENQQPSSLQLPALLPQTTDKLPGQLTQRREPRGAALYSYLAWWLQFCFKLNCSKSAFQACIHENLPGFSNCKTQCGNINHLCLQPCLGLLAMVTTILTLSKGAQDPPVITWLPCRTLGDPLIDT